MSDENLITEDTPDCLNIGGDDPNPSLWVEEVCDMVGCSYRDGCKFYLDYYDCIQEEDDDF